MVHPEAIEEIAQAVRHAHDPFGDGLFDIENRHLRRSDGAVRWLTTRSQTFFEGEGEGRRPVRTIGALVDVTDRRQAEERLRQQATLLEATHDAIIVFEPDRGIRFMNAAAEKLTGWALAQARSRDLTEVLRPRNELSLGAAIREVNSRSAWSGELSLPAKDGKTIVLDSRWATIPERPGESKCILITCNDITEKKLLEAQYLRAQRLESVGTLASGVAHDLNNILSPIMMGVEMLAESVPDADSHSLLAMMRDCAQRGSDTVNQLLTFARGTKCEKGPVQPSHLLKEIARLLQQTLPKNIQIYTDAAQQSAMVLADSSQLHQVLMNLCVNARDAMPEGGGLFLVLENRTLDASGAALHPKARPIPYVVFKVSDSGTGIPPEILDRIFDPFFTSKPQGKGTGLGLSTVLGIVENHGGFVLVESKLGQGTTFLVYLPAIAPSWNVGSRAEPAVIPRGQGELVLVVDDENAILHMVEGILQRNGYATLTASYASEAIHLFENHSGLVRAVLTDIMMPVGDGRKLISMLHERAPQLPIIAMSGLATAEFQNETILHGARAFLRKPFTSEQLLTMLSAALKPRPGGT